ncbi:MAG: hypothetical protein IKK77_05975 [Clostridia bacterium]|nr:hypothetical protein [Clostridia bacterium]
MIKKTLSVFIVLIMCLSLSACNESYKDAYIYFELNSIPSTLDPQLVSTKDEITAVRCLFDGLMRYDSEGKCVPSAAESYEKNGLSYTFIIKEDAAWKNGQELTSDDFVFAFRRAIDPKTKAPFSTLLYSIKNAKSIAKGELSPDNLGVYSLGEKILKIELEYEDSEFLNTLTTPITMPCNEEFFESCKGKYGLNIDALLCNGSYYVRKWYNEDKFLIRLAKNLDFKGPFEANSMRVYFTCTDSDNSEAVSKYNSDLAYISEESYNNAKDLNLGIINEENSCYMLYVDNDLPQELRQALLKSVDIKNLASSLNGTDRTANHIYPGSLNLGEIHKASDIISYNLEEAQNLYNQALKSNESPNITLKFYGDKTTEDVSKTIAAHWQKNLGEFINIEKVNTLSSAENIFDLSQNTVLILPFYTSCGSWSTYLSQFGITNMTPNEAQTQLLSNYTLLPLYFSNSYIIANDYIKNLDTSVSYGIPDIALLIKEE